MKLFRDMFFKPKDRDLHRKNGTSVHVSKRDEIEKRKLRKKGLIK